MKTLAGYALVVWLVQSAPVALEAYSSCHMGCMALESVEEPVTMGKTG